MKFVQEPSPLWAFPPLYSVSVHIGALFKGINRALDF